MAQAVNIRTEFRIWLAVMALSIVALFISLYALYRIP